MKAFASPSAPDRPGGEGRLSLRARALAGSMWTVAAHGGRQALRLGSNLLLAHWLFPEAFGVMALVNVVVHALEMVSDLGIGPCIIQHPRGDDRAFLDTGWTVQIIRSFMLWGCSLALAWPAAALYGHDEIAWLIPVAAFSAVISGFNSTKLYTQKRSLALGRLAAISLGAQAAGIVVMLAWALAAPSVLALAAGALVAALVKMVLSHAALPGVRNRLRMDREAGVAFFRFGRWVLLSTLMGFLAVRADRLLMGELVPLDLLGVFALAISLVEMPRGLCHGLIEAVWFPALARHVRNGAGSLATGLRVGRRAILPAGLVSMLGVVLLGPPFFRHLYDERYADAAWMVQLLALPAWIAVLSGSAGVALLSLGDSRSLFAGSAVQLVLTAFCCVAGFAALDVPGFILGLACGELGGYAVLQAILARQGVRLFRRDLAYTCAFAAMSAAGVVLPRVGAPVRDGAPDSVAALAVSAALLLAAGCWALRGVRAALRSGEASAPPAASFP